MTTSARDVVQKITDKIFSEYETATCDWREDWHVVTDSIVELLAKQGIVIPDGLIEKRLIQAARTSKVGLVEFFAAFDEILAQVDRRIHQRKTDGDYYCFSVVPRQLVYQHTDDVISEFERESENEFQHD